MYRKYPDRLLAAFTDSLTERVRTRAMSDPDIDLEYWLKQIAPSKGPSDFVTLLLDALLEVLNSEPSAAGGLLPRFERLIESQIAWASTGRQVNREEGYVLAEIDVAVWDRLMESQFQAASSSTLGADNSGEWIEDQENGGGSGSKE